MPQDLPLREHARGWADGRRPRADGHALQGPRRLGGMQRVITGCRMVVVNHEAAFGVAAGKDNFDSLAYPRGRIGS